MGVQTARVTRREQRREETTAEIKALALEQVAEGGPEALSLNGIARTMGMSPAALYRYFDSREALLTDLVVDTYDDFADALAVAGTASGSADGRKVGTPDQRLSAVAHASRSWALAQPNSYRLIFQSTVGSGQDLAPERTVPAASRSMGVLVAALAEVAQRAGPRPRTRVETLESDPAPRGVALLGQLAAWAERTGQTGVSPRVAALGFRAWTRLHGVISLELGHHLASTGIDPALLYAAEVEALVREARTIG